MGYSFLDFMKRIGIFIVCAQSFIHFAAGKSYEKYIKLLVGVMILAQFVVPVRALLSGGEEGEIWEEVEYFQKEMEDILNQTIEQTIPVPGESYEDGLGAVDMLEREMKEKLSGEAEAYGYRVTEAKVCEDPAKLFVTITGKTEKQKKVNIEKIQIGDTEKSEEEYLNVSEEMKEKFGIVLGINPSYIEIRKE